MIFMDLGCLGPLVVDLGRVFRAVAPLPRNSIRLWSVHVARRAGIKRNRPARRVILQPRGDFQVEGWQNNFGFLVGFSIIAPDP